jgi:hypothetical protein
LDSGAGVPSASAGIFACPAHFLRSASLFGYPWLTFHMTLFLQLPSEHRASHAVHWPLHDAHRVWRRLSCGCWHLILRPGTPTHLQSSQYAARAIPTPAADLVKPMRGVEAPHEVHFPVDVLVFAIAVTAGSGLCACVIPGW